VGGLGMVGIATAVPPTTEAKITAKVGRIGAIMTPAGDAAINNLPAGNYKYGLVALSGTGNFDLSLPVTLYQKNAAVFARSDETGVYGSGSNYGLYGSGVTAGVYGISSNVGVYGTGTSYGVYGSNTVTGVYGEGTTYGVKGTGTSYGIYGFGNTGAYGDGEIIGGNFNGGSVGVGAETFSNSLSGSLATNTSVGLIATAGISVDLGSLFAPNQNCGLYATAGNYGGRNPTAAYFQGTVAVAGTLSKTAGSFKIDHPLDPTNKYLYHSFVESPDMLNIYNGIATLNEQGEAIVEMPDWFEALNRDYRYQLTCLGQYAPVFIAEKIKEGKFKIAGGQLGQEISWQVTGIRQDAYAKAHPIPVEEVKGEGEKGKYLHPEVFGQAKQP